MLPTPNIDHLNKKDFELIYEPAEDTFILLDALEKDAELLRELKPRVCLEIGSGSGIVSTFIGGQILGPSNCLYLSTDINAHASLCTVLTGRQNKVSLEAITASLFTPVTLRLHHNVDLLVFNPPYVPTNSSEADEAQISRSIGGSWAGGLTGMEVTEVVLGQLDDMLSEKGFFYLVAIKQNDIPAIRERMLRVFGFESKVVLQRRAGIEHLYTIRFQRKDSGRA